MRKNTRLSTLFRTASDGKLGSENEARCQLLFNTNMQNQLTGKGTTVYYISDN